MKDFLQKYCIPVLKTVAFILIFVLLFSYIQDIFKLKGSGYGKYRYFSQEKNNTINVMFFGNSRCNRAFDPITIDGISGTYSYNLGIQGLRSKHVYIRMKDAFKTQTPQLVVIETGILTPASSETLEEQYNHRTLDSLPASPFKLMSAIELGKTKEDVLELSLPLVRFHSRYEEIGAVDFLYNMNLNEEYDYEGREPEEVMMSHRGYSSYATAKELDESYHKSFTKDYTNIRTIAELDEETQLYLEKMVELCRENNAEILFVSVPALSKSSGYKVTIPITNYLKQRYADDPDVKVLDFYMCYEEIGLDHMYFQNTNHLNVEGAQLASEFMGRFIRDNYTIQ